MTLGRGTTLTHFTGPSDDPDRHRWEVYSDARGMNRSDVLALMGALAESLRIFPAPSFYDDLKFSNDTAEIALDGAKVLRRERDDARKERDDARRDLERIISG